MHWLTEVAYSSLCLRLVVHGSNCTTVSVHQLLNAVKTGGLVPEVAATGRIRQVVAVLSVDPSEFVVPQSLLISKR